ncbi:MAG: putative replicase [Cressdnaviricota sp.]|nr:MAG: putative replicase [Cressdnaviricota sp.]
MRARGFLVVLHDSHLGTQSKQAVIDHLLLKEPVQAVVAHEPYEHQEGHHIHIFYRLKSQSDFKAQLKHWCLWYKSGRVQVDIMRGEISQACRYLIQDQTKKDKTCDPSPWLYPTVDIVKSAAEHADEWMDWFLSTTVQEWKQIRTEHRDKFLVGWAKSQENLKNKNIGVC